MKLPKTVSDYCKKCNKHAYDFLSEEEIEKQQLEHELQLIGEAKRKIEEEAKKEEAKEEAAEGAEEKPEEEKKEEEKPEEGEEPKEEKREE